MKLRDAAAHDKELSYLIEKLFIENERILFPLINTLSNSDIEAYVARATQVCDSLSKIYDGDFPNYIDNAIKGLQFHSIEFLRLQSAFGKTLSYAAESAQKVFDEVYNSSDVMKEYLDGLLLTYIAWPNHFKLIDYYENQFVSRCPVGKCLEIGPGHGLLSLILLQQNSNRQLVGIDISSQSVEYSTQMLHSHGVPENRFSIKEADATQGIRQNDKFDCIVVAEVLEHIKCPDLLLKDVKLHAHPDTLMFMSTVVNIESIDHLYLYRTLEDVNNMFKDCGLEIIDQLNMPLDLGNVDYEAYELGIICKIQS